MKCDRCGLPEEHDFESECVQAQHERIAELEGVVEAIMLEYEDETPRDADVVCDRMARLARAVLGPKVVVQNAQPLRPADHDTNERNGDG